MARQKRGAKHETPPAAAEIAPEPFPETQVFTGGLSLHDMFQQQVRQTLDQSDLDEDSKQAVLVAMSCPCCGTGGMNYTVKLRRRS